MSSMDDQAYQQQYRRDADLLVRSLVDEFNAREERHTKLAGGEHSPEWINFGKLWEDEPTQRKIGRLLIDLPNLLTTEVVVGVPHGGAKWAETVHEMTGIILIRLCKLPARGRAVFDFFSEEDEQNAQNAQSATIFEDAVYHGGDAAAVRRMLPEDCDTDLRAIWLRGTLLAENDRLFRAAHVIVDEEFLAYPEQSCPEHGDYEQ